MDYMVLILIALEIIFAVSVLVWGFMLAYPTSPRLCLQRS
ncbi:hypothetical protein JOD50_001119 [Pseudoglutamicibacter cumminsii]|nr:hypothetical protein [Pseudoglutamicibacter cumminsii]